MTDSIQYWHKSMKVRNNILILGKHFLIPPCAKSFERTFSFFFKGKEDVLPHKAGTRLNGKVRERDRLKITVNRKSSANYTKSISPSEEDNTEGEI